MNPSQPDPDAPPRHDEAVDSGRSEAPGAADPLARALALVRFLRARCPWDAAQTPRTLVPYLLEEAHETADAIAAGDDGALRDELGDLLLNLAFQIVLAEEREAFDADNVVDAVEAKMRRRHPHIYGEAADDVGPRSSGVPDVPDGHVADWERLKAAERGRDSILSGLSPGLDPLSRAHRIQDRVSAVGFDWADVRGALDKVAEELEEVRAALEAGPPPTLEEELGDLLFAVVNLNRLAGAHALTALQQANLKFSRRFRALEALARERDITLGEATLEQLDALWNEIKRSEAPRP